MNDPENFLYNRNRMKVTIDDVKHIAMLAKLELDPEELSTFTSQLDSILVYFEKLKELDTEGIEPTFQITAFQTHLRVDETTPSLSKDESLKNAPEQEKGHFKVPRVIG